MKVLFAAVEMSPLAKVGGLGDIAGSLPRALRALGADVRVALPMHSAIERTALDLRLVLRRVKVPRPGGGAHIDVWATESRGAPVYLLENERYFGRSTIYGSSDDVERFLFYCDAVLACASHLGFKPDVVHAQDWHAAFLLSRLAADQEHVWADAARVYTIHNLGLPGSFEAAFARRFGISARQLVPPGGLPPDIAFSAMAQGIMHADRINTVSETYAREIMTPEYGAGLDGLLRARADIVSGIVNGIDYDEFNPATDPAIARRYSVDSLDERAANKRALQTKAALPISDDIPLFGIVTRLFAQKGIDLAAEAFDAMLADSDAQLVVLGTGDEAVQRMLVKLEAKYPQQVKLWLDFDAPLGQQIYAGCDCFLMPSRYEPCGLGQLIALRYGAVPIVRRTGGLADTVQDAGSQPGTGTGTGFVFDAATAREVEAASRRAAAALADRPAWRALQERGMRQDWSWRRAASTYIALYERAIEDRRRALEQAGA